MSKYEVGDKVRYINAAKALREGFPWRYGIEMTIVQVLRFGRYVANFQEKNRLGGSSLLLIIIRSSDVELMESAGDKFMQELVGYKAKEHSDRPTAPIPQRQRRAPTNDFNVSSPPNRGSSVQPPLPIRVEMDVRGTAELKKGAQEAGV